MPITLREAIIPKVELRIDVTAEAGFGQPAQMAATAHLPDPSRMPARPVAIFAVPGGGYSRGYYDMHFAGHAGYSQAEHCIARGIILVAFDHVGVGDSTVPEVDTITEKTLSATYHAAVREVVARLRQGTLCDGFPPVADPFTVGIGQSMGGKVTMVTQARHATFDAVGILGSSAIWSVTPVPPEYAGVRSEDIPAHARGWAFHWEDVPADILELDEIVGVYPARRTNPPFASSTMPGHCYRFVQPGAVKQEAAAIRVPVLIAMGERDVCATPRDEPAAFAASDDITLQIVPNMAHMHNFASTRRIMWDRIADWSEMLARRAR